MNNDIIEGNWKQMIGSVKSKWAKLTDDHLAGIEGNRTKLVGLIQENYGILRDEAEKQLSEWESDQKKMNDKIFKGTI